MGASMVLGFRSLRPLDPKCFRFQVLCNVFLVPVVLQLSEAHNGGTLLQLNVVYSRICPKP